MHTGEIIDPNPKQKCMACIQGSTLLPKTHTINTFDKTSIKEHPKPRKKKIKHNKCKFST